MEEEEEGEEGWQRSPLPAQGHPGCSPGLPHRTKLWRLQGLLKSAMSRALPLSVLVSITIPAQQHLCGHPRRVLSHPDHDAKPPLHSGPTGPRATAPAQMLVGAGIV